MTIEEAIIRIEETAKNYSDEYEFYLNYGKQEEAQENFRYYSEQRQIAEWLKELKAIKECLKDKCLACEHCAKCREEYK